MTKLLQGRPTRSFIDHDALRWNLRQIKKQIGPRVKILSMVKANGYGHGAVEVARTLAKSGSNAFGVATVEEGIELRQGRIRQPILVLAGAYVEQLDQLIKFKLIPVLHDSKTLKAFEKKTQQRNTILKFQLEVDTGMGRIGFPSNEIETWLAPLGKLKTLKLAGIFSHFSEAESANEKYAAAQLKSFQRVLDRLRDAGIVYAPSHMSKSAALITVPAANFSMVRPGLILYGMYPAANLRKRISLKPVLTWKTRIIQLKRSPIGTSIGYGRTFVTKRNSLIATLPVGYADGYRRLLSNRGQVLVRGQRAPVVGRVSMDLTTVDVTDIRNVQQGDEVVLLGRQGSGEIPADEMAAWANTISYEIFTSIGDRVPRIHVNQ